MKLILNNDNDRTLLVRDVVRSLDPNENAVFALNISIELEEDVLTYFRPYVGQPITDIKVLADDDSVLLHDTDITAHIESVVQHINESWRDTSAMIIID